MIDLSPLFFYGASIVEHWISPETGGRVARYSGPWVFLPNRIVAANGKG
jgi:hypothetical protein